LISEPISTFCSAGWNVASGSPRASRVPGERAARHQIALNFADRQQPLLVADVAFHLVKVRPRH
jgi:hypothetical protein